MLKELDSVVLTTDVPEHGLKAGDLGVIVHSYRNNEAFEVEFMTLAGKTVAVTTLLASQVRAISTQRPAPSTASHRCLAQRWAPLPQAAAPAAAFF